MKDNEFANFSLEPDHNLLIELSRAAAETGDREFLRDDSGSYSFEDIHRRVRVAAQYLLCQGIARGDRVAIRLPNGAQWVVAWFAIWTAGGVAVPTNYSYEVSDLDYVLSDSGAAAIIADPASEDIVSRTPTHARGAISLILKDDLSTHAVTDDQLPPMAAVELSSLANLQYTSGTTGFPKACMLTHEYWMRLGLISVSATCAAAGDVMLTAQPYSYIDPLWNTALCLIARIPLVIKPRFSASLFWQWVRDEGVTFFYVLGTMPTLLYKQPPRKDDLENEVRLVLCSGIPPALHAELEARWGAPWREAYGLTETGIDIQVPIEGWASVGSGSIGWPIETKQARIVDSQGRDVERDTPGELVLRGKPMMTGYWNRPEETAIAFQDDCFHTGDIASMSTDGSLKLVGRLKDMIRRGGENISAAEVENIANEHYSVVSSAVVGVADELWGEEVKLFVQTKPGSSWSAELAGAIADHIGSNLARFKRPRYLTFVESFPLTPSARISKPDIPGRFSVDESVFTVDYSTDGAVVGGKE